MTPHELTTRLSSLLGHYDVVGAGPAVDLVLDTLDEWHGEGEFFKSREFLSSMYWDHRLMIRDFRFREVIIAILAVTRPAHHELGKARADFYTRVEHIFRAIYPHDWRRLLMGLREASEW